MGPAQSAITPPTPKTSGPVCLGPNPRPAMYDWQLWMRARPSLWIALAIIGVTTVSRGQHPCACMCLFVFPASLVGVGLGYVRGMAAVFCRPENWLMGQLIDL
jgi:hypothetical protein